MAIQLSVSVRNSLLDAIETTIGTSPRLQIRTGLMPSDCSAADSGTLLVEMTLPSDWMAAAASGSKAKLGTWQAVATASGTAGHFRIKNNAGDITHIQGTVATSNGDLLLDNVQINSGQTVTINSFTLTGGNA